jgi:hypothetical protein
MLNRLCRPSPAFVISLIALFVALGGTTYAATGGNVVLGKANTATSQTGLTANSAGKALSITQQSTRTGATALGLNVPAGKPPMTVNSGTKVASLNADKLDGIDSTAFATKKQEAWHEVGTAGEPSFNIFPDSPEWANWGGGINTVGFYKDSVGEVHLKGLFKSTSGYGSTDCDTFPQQVFQLPTGYRPAATALYPNLHNSSTGRIDIHSTGWVTICQPSSWSNGDFFSLDGISFRAAG